MWSCPTILSDYKVQSLAKDFCPGCVILLQSPRRNPATSETFLRGTVVTTDVPKTYRTSLWKLLIIHIMDLEKTIWLPCSPKSKLKPPPPNSANANEFSLFLFIIRPLKRSQKHGLWHLRGPQWAPCLPVCHTSRNWWIIHLLRVEREKNLMKFPLQVLINGLNQNKRRRKE